MTATRALLFLHGYGSNRAGYVERSIAAASALNAICLALDFGGHGDSEGDPALLALADHFEEVQAAFDRLATVAGPVAAVRIGVCGASYGGYLASVLVAVRPVWRLLLRAPALYADDEFTLRPAERIGLSSGDQFHRLELGARAFSGETLIVESSRDSEVKPKMINAYVRIFSRAERTIIEADHALETREQRAVFRQAILDWFAD